jgi:hypothetical protein
LESEQDVKTDARCDICMREREKERREIERKESKRGCAGLEGVVGEPPCVAHEAQDRTRLGLY